MTSNKDHDTPQDLAHYDPSGSTALIALGIMWGAGFFSLGYMAGVWGWV